MPDPSREAYLAELEALLPFPPERRAEVLEEIGAHLDDAAADGLSETRAQARLGTPIDLARELARPEQSPMRLLAAAGAGVRAAIGPWLYGYLLTALIVFVALWVTSAVLMVVSQLVARDLFISLSGGWSTAATSIPLAVALFFAGRAATSAASVTARRLRSDVQPWVAGIGTALAAVVLIFVMEGPQHLGSVVALFVAPLGVAVGAYRPDLVAARPRIAPMAALVAALLLIALSLLAWAVMPPTVHVGEEIPAETLEQRTAVVGPTWGSTDGPLLIESSSWSSEDGVISAEWQPQRPGLLDRFSDLRLEAWHAQDGSPWRFDSSYPAPFAIGTVQVTDGVLTGSVVTDRDPDVDEWHLVLTGRGPDGVRYVLDASGSGQSTFTGTAWDWVAAVSD